MLISLGDYWSTVHKRLLILFLQTGSGKTHTICGSEGEEGRGIIPRTFQHLFDAITSKSLEGEKTKLLKIFNYSFQFINDFVIRFQSLSNTRWTLRTLRFTTKSFTIYWVWRLTTKLYTRKNVTSKWTKKIMINWREYIYIHVYTN